MGSGTSTQPIPIHFSFAENDHIEGTLSPERRLLMRDVFDLPDLGSMDDGIAKMRPVKGGLEIKPGETVELKPGSFHVMFVGLKKPLSAGDQFKATLVFEKAGSVDIDYDVRTMGSQPGGAMPGMKH